MRILLTYNRCLHGKKTAMFLSKRISSGICISILKYREQLCEKNAQRKQDPSGELSVHLILPLSNGLQLAGAAKGLEYLHSCNIIHGNCMSYAVQLS